LLAELARGHCGTTTTFNGHSENVIVKAIIIAKLEFRNVTMQISFADIGECVDDVSLEDAPEAFNRVGMNRADNVLPVRMVNGGSGGALR
jgi:hypothetical protein